MEPVAGALRDADGFAVARVEEGLRLRAAGVDKPILILAGALFSEEVDAASRHEMALAVHHEEQVALLERMRPVRPLRVWLKVDTGMHRLGVDPGVVPAVLERLRGCTAVDPRIGLMTHLANADDPRDPLSDLQCGRLRALGRQGQPLSIGNSGGILAIRGARSDWVRPGIMLYGASPFTGRSAEELGLVPVMTLRARIISVRHLRRGDRVGYGGTFVCPEDMPVAVAAVGYGDGYPRHAPAGTPVLVNGVRAPLVGRVSMDSISVDVRGVPKVDVGDEVTLWGASLPVEEIAGLAGTISYELFCGLNTRVRREYLKDSTGNGFER
jgi:alanine racemase